MYKSMNIHRHITYKHAYRDMYNLVMQVPLALASCDNNGINNGLTAFLR